MYDRRRRIDEWKMKTKGYWYALKFKSLNTVESWKDIYGYRIEVAESRDTAKQSGQIGDGKVKAKRTSRI